ncbi:hypothetical protein KY285_013205 [Solanum tuberosum]|nr:hypothetical protein KY285_013205 [Solanum tuberosum]
MVQELREESSHNKNKGQDASKEVKQHQEEQWQTQKRNSNNQVPTQKGMQVETDQQFSKQPGMTSIPTYNTIVDLDMQEQTNSQVEKENQQEGKNATLTLQVAPEPAPKSPTHSKVLINQQSNEQEGQNKKTTGIDSVLPKSQNPFSILSDVADEVEGGMDGGCQEKPTNLQEGVSKGGNLTHVLHEVAHTDYRPDLRTSATTQQVPTKQNHNQTKEMETDKVKNTEKTQKQLAVKDNTPKGTPSSKKKQGDHQVSVGEQHHQNDTEVTRKQTSNKVQGRLSKKKRKAIKKRQQNEAKEQSNTGHDKGETGDQNQKQNTSRTNPKSDYDVLNSEDELDEDTQYINEIDDNEEDEETSAQLIKAFGSTFLSDYQDEVQEVTAQQGLSPRERRTQKQSKQLATTSSSATSSRPNTRSINPQGSLERLQSLKKIHHTSIIAILEPFADKNHINNYRIMLNMDNAISNDNGKIWLFWTNDITYTLAECDDQQITGDRMLQISTDNGPWCTIGDFNVITSTEEKKGGVPYNMNKSLEFISVIEACGLVDLGYSGQHFTWCNQRAEQARVWKRLDKAMVNDKWLEIMPQTNISHLPSVGSDHTPLLMEMTVNDNQGIKYFKFLQCWVDNDSFMDTVTSYWNKEVHGNPMWRWNQKMKKLTTTISAWSKKEFGDIYSKVKEFEERVKVAEDELINNNIETNRQNLHYINATYIKYLKIEEGILKQKTQLQWFKEGDAN